ncbi:hypothetical protein JTB14_003494 [Gonioctena quinquepunctata]|nr:hypothetical protein JTB14_003494 [Gonioctena quinquepunctata]
MRELEGSEDYKEKHSEGIVLTELATSEISFKGRTGLCSKLVATYDGICWALALSVPDENESVPKKKPKKASINGREHAGYKAQNSGSKRSIAEEIGINEATLKKRLECGNIHSHWEGLQVILLLIRKPNKPNEYKIWIGYFTYHEERFTNSCLQIC